MRISVVTQRHDSGEEIRESRGKGRVSVGLEDLGEAMRIKDAIGPALEFFL